MPALTICTSVDRELPSSQSRAAAGTQAAEGQRLIAEAMPLFEQQQPHLAQHLRAWAPACRHRLRRAHQHETLVEQRRLGQPRLRHRQRDDGGVEPAVPSSRKQLGRQRLAHADVEIDMLSATGPPMMRDWWPNQLNLKILHQNSAGPTRWAGFDYAEAFKKLDLKALKKGPLPR
jgi:hypothetical protein